MAAPPSGKGGANLVSVAKLVMESAMKAGVNIDQKGAQNYAKQLGKLQSQSKKKGGSLGQVQYSVSKFMASHNASRANSATAAAAAVAPSQQTPNSNGANATIKPSGGAYGRSSLQNVIANELLRAKAGSAVASTPPSEAQHAPQQKVSLRRLVSAAYMPQTIPSASASSTNMGTDSKSDALSLGLPLRGPKRPETKLSERSGSSHTSASLFAAKTPGASSLTPKQATLSLSEFLAAHVKVPTKGAATSDVHVEANMQTEAKVEAKTPQQEDATVDLGVSLASSTKKRTTLGSLSATLAAAASARQRQLAEERLKADQKTSTTVAAPTVANQPKKPSAATPLQSLFTASPVVTPSSTDAKSMPKANSLSEGFSLAEEDTFALFGDEPAATVKPAPTMATFTTAQPVLNIPRPIIQAPAAYTVPQAATYSIPTPMATASDVNVQSPAEVAVTSAAEWEEQREREMLALRKAQKEEEERLLQIELDRKHSAMGEQWVQNRLALAKGVLVDVATGKTKVPQLLSQDFYHKFREELYFLRDPNAPAAASFDPVAGVCLDTTGTPIPEREPWVLAIESYERAAASATLTNPLPAYFPLLLRRQTTGAPFELRAKVIQILNDQCQANKNLQVTATILELQNLAASGESQKMIDTYYALPAERRNQLPRSVHMKVLIRELSLNVDPANDWRKAIALADSYTKVHGPQKGAFERLILRFYAVNRKGGKKTISRDTRKQICEVMAARFEAMKVEPMSRGGAVEDSATTVITTTFTDPSKGVPGEPTEATTTTSTYTLPSALGGGPGPVHLNRIWLALAARGRSSRNSLNHIIAGESHPTDDFAVAFALQRATEEDLPSVLAAAEAKHIDMNHPSILASRIQRAATLEEVNQLLEDVEIKGALDINKTLIQGALSKLREGDYEHKGLLRRIRGWYDKLGPKRFTRLSRSYLLIGHFVQGDFDFVIRQILENVAKSMTVFAIKGIDVTKPPTYGVSPDGRRAPTAPYSFTNNPAPVPDLSDPLRDPYSLDGLVINPTTISDAKLKLLNSALLKLGLKPVTEGPDSVFAVVTHAQRQAFAAAREEAGATGRALDKVGDLNLQSLGADSSDVDMPYRDTLLQHAKDRNWSAAVALMPQFPKRVPPQQVSALTLLFNCVLSAAVEKPDVVENVLNEMRNTNAVPNATTFNTVMSSYARSESKWRDALDIYPTIPAATRDVSTYSVVLSIMCKQDMPTEAFALYEEMSTSNLVKPLPVVYGLAIQAVHKHSWENTFTIFKDLIKTHGPAAAKELLVARVKKTLEENGRTQELAEMDKLLTSAPGKKQKRQKGNQPQQQAQPANGEPSLLANAPKLDKSAPSPSQAVAKPATLAKPGPADSIEDF